MESGKLLLLLVEVLSRRQYIRPKNEMGDRHGVMARRERAAALTDEAAATAKKSGGGGGGIIKTTSVPAHVLQRFWDLASTDPETRCATAAALSEELRAIQNEEEDEEEHGGGGGGGGGAMTSRGPDPVVEYSMKRLTRGLGSGRAGARQGFAVAFTSALTQLDAIAVEDGFRYLKEGLEPITKSTKGTEARDILIGQLFGNAALAGVDCERCVARSEEKEEKRDEEL